MIENKKLKLESNAEVKNTKLLPWYKKKRNVIVSISILGVGLLATAIAVPIALTDQKPPNSLPPINPEVPPNNSIVTPEDVNKALTAINDLSNKSTRIDIWNEYMKTLLKSDQVNVPPPISQIVYTQDFIDQFVALLANNLIVDDSATPVVGSITSGNLKIWKKDLDTWNSNNLFQNTQLTRYTNDFLLFGPANTLMFEFKTNIVISQDNFQLFIPASSLDLIYNSDKSITINIESPSPIVSNNARLKILDSYNNVPSKDYYFKSGTISIELPQKITSNFSYFLDKKILEEKANAINLSNNLANIQNAINSDITLINSLSYWNSFALNYANSNKVFVEADLKKEISQSGILTFLQTNIPSISDIELNEIKSIAQNSVDINVSKTPYANISNHEELLFDSNKSGVNNYKLKLNVINFNFDYKINSLFQLSNAIDVMPKLVLNGKLVKTTSAGLVSEFHISSLLPIDVKQMINMSLASDGNNGGLSGFLTLLALNDTNIISKLTKALVSFNNGMIDDQIIFWNNFVLNSNVLITEELIKSNVLSDFIFANIDKGNVFTDAIGTNVFPSIIDATLKNSININVANLPIVDLRFSIDSPAIVLNDIQYGALSTDVFTNISLYFGSDLTSILNMNIISAHDSNSNLFISQRMGETTITNVNADLEAKKRLSIVFTDSSNKKYVIYLGQYNNGSPSSQFTKPIIIPNAILTTQTKFIDAIIKSN